MTRSQEPIRVFISYAHTEDHPQRVRQLADRLRGDGLHVVIDQHEQAPEEGWRAWMEAEIRAARWVLQVCSERCFRLSQGLDPPGAADHPLDREMVLFDRLSPAERSASRWVPIAFTQADAQFVTSGLRQVSGFRLDGPQGYGALLHHLLRGNPTGPSGVPSTAPQRQSTGPTVVSGAPAPNIAPNPFTDLGPIRDPARSVGRARELGRLLARLQGGSVNLHGPPKIGKTTLALRLIEAWQGEAIGPIDLHLAEDRDDFYHLLASELGVGSHDWRSLREALRQWKLLLVLDELDAGPRLGLEPRDLQRFRAIEQRNPDFHLLALSRRPLKANFPDDPQDGSPGFNLMPPTRLGPLTAEESRELLSHPWAPLAHPFSADQVEEILRDLEQAGCSGHPCWLQRAGHHQYEALTDPRHDWRRGWRDERSHLE